MKRKTTHGRFLSSLTRLLAERSAEWPLTDVVAGCRCAGCEHVRVVCGGHEGDGPV